MIKKLSVLCVALCVGTSLYAQKNPAKRLKVSKNVSRSTLNTSLERATAQQHLPQKQTPGKVITTPTGSYFYHPVFGYVPSTSTSLNESNMYFAVGETIPQNDDAEIQRSPFFEHQVYHTLLGRNQAFELGEYIDLPDITQAGYLWLVAHPDKSLQDNPYLYDWAQLHLKQIREECMFNAREMWEFPNYLLLERLLRPDFTPTSYAQLYELTPVYPKHVTLNASGFPVKTADDDYASLLDAYLMLSNPKEMSAYHTYGIYTPFILTKEEHAAADKLLALRLQGEKLPANPTPLAVLEVAYNRLETHTTPYSQISEEESVSGRYKAYPHYKNTQLYRTIKGMIKDQKPIESRDLSGYIVLENEDITHLIVLDAVMGGVDPNNLAEVDRALEAFEKLCAEIHPDDEQAISHMAILQKNLRAAFDELIDFSIQTIDWDKQPDHLQYKAAVGNYAWALLEGCPVRHLVGLNWLEQHRFDQR